MKNSEPKGEKISLEFYDGGRDSADLMRDVAGALLARGAQIKWIEAIDAPDARGIRFERWGPLSAVFGLANLSASDAIEALSSSNCKVGRLGIVGGVSAGERLAEVVDYSPLSASAFEVDSHPVALIAEGWVFSTPRQERQAIRRGRQCFETFVAICERIRPQYAAILNEQTLKGAADVGGCDGREFTNYYVRNDIVDFDEVVGLYNSCVPSFLLRLEAGSYVSTWAPFNPEAITSPRSSAIGVGAGVAKLLHSRLVNNVRVDGSHATLGS